MIEDGGLDRARAERYAAWETPAAKAMLGSDLAAIAARVEAEGIDPQPRSGRQEKLENWVNRFV
jgi:xylose isomerase